MKYQTDRKWAFSGALLLALLLVVLWTSPSVWDNLIFALGATLFFVFVMLWSFWGVYLTIGDRKVCHINYFFLKKCFEIENINAIYYQPSWSVGEAARSQSIIDLSTGKQQHISLPNLGFSERTLAQIAQHLKKLNPSIRLDEHAVAVIKKHE